MVGHTRTTMTRTVQQSPASSPPILVTPSVSLSTTGTQTETSTSIHLDIEPLTCVATSHSLALSGNEKKKTRNFTLLKLSLQAKF